MSSYQTQSADTSVEAERVMFDRYRSMGPAEKLRLFRDLSAATQQFALAGLRRRHPSASDHELKMRLVATRFSQATMKEVFDWPEDS